MTRLICHTFLLVLFLTALGIGARAQAGADLRGPYLGQTPPGKTPKVFAPDIISLQNAIHGHIAFSADGKEIFWILLPPANAQTLPAIHFIRQDADGRWSKPAILEFSREFGVMNFSLSPDGKKLFFVSREAGTDSGSRRPSGNTLEAFKVRVAERTESGWGAPTLLEQKINREITGVCSTLDGTLYTHGIKRSRLKNGEYAEWEPLGPPLDVGRIGGGHPFVSPDERYVLFCQKWQGHSGYGIFVSFHAGENRWTEPVNLLEKLNAPRGGSQPLVTPDGRYLFYYAEGRFHWVEASIIEELRPKNQPVFDLSGK